MILFLHNKGYSFFNIPSLTYAEIHFLVDAHNLSVKDEENRIRKAQRRKK